MSPHAAAPAPDGARYPYITLVLRSWAVVVAAMLVGAAAAWGLSQLATPGYRSTASLYFSLNTGDSGSDLNQGSTYALSQMQSYARLATTSQVLDPVIDRMGLDTSSAALAASITAVVPQNTVMLQLSASSPDPERASAVANEVARSLAVVVEELTPSAERGDRNVAVFSVSPAQTPTAAATPNTRLNVLIGLLLGLVLSVVTVLLRALGDTRIRAEEDVAAVTTAPVLGALAFDDERRGAEVLTATGGQHEAERYRQLRSALEAALPGENGRSIAVASPASGAGASTVAANLAVAFSEGGHRVILVEGNLRSPSLADFTGAEGAEGVTTVVADSRRFSSAVQKWASGPEVLTAGPLPANPAGVLNSPGMERLMGMLREQYDAIIIDVPAVNEAADAGVLARLTDGALLVVDSAHTRRPELSEAVRALRLAGSEVLGVAINQAERRGRRTPAPRAQRRAMTATEAAAS